MTKSIEDFRWDPYFIRSGKGFDNFWNKYLQNPSNILYILGRGFDPRMCKGICSIFGIKGSGIRDCILICYDEGPNSPSEKYKSRLELNMDKLTYITDKAGKLQEKNIDMWSSESTGSNRRRVGSIKALNTFKDISELAMYDDIIIDISSMPRGIYFPLIVNVLSLLDNPQGEIEKIPNLYIVVAEDAELDYKICEVGIDENANYISGFSGDLYMESTTYVPKVWFPILGEGKHDQLQRMHDHIVPDEICPVLPSPSSDPRRGDNLLISYRRLIFDEWHVDTKNIIYSNEKNPFETYRQLVKAINHYTKALEPLSGCKPVISALSSKLISLGALLAAYDLKDKKINVGLVNIEAQGYEIIDLEKDIPISSGQLFTLLIKGEDYDS